MCVLGLSTSTHYAKRDSSSRALSQILVVEGLHPFYDDRVADLLDFKIYLDISDDVKFAWKVQRDMKERGHSEESIRQSIESRKPDFDAYIDPQKEKADVVIQVPLTPQCRSCQGVSLGVSLCHPVYYCLVCFGQICLQHSPSTCWRHR